ncbi:hypothetical protein [Nocardiopsis sp. MG754419]|uniref:hypothetical protein n=1 Tax=Nocardiopsis sp. MG754419 TaxID=2259865 RepID=UPI001BA7EE50|nr:hypothetical protein [Nocardiopsis sp. MG754419]MBR8744692.1 hypothetical protein [Nocardiopsis sp. MG754419]
MYDHDPTDPLILGGTDLLTEDERTVGLAYLQLSPLLEALQAHPFHSRVYAELREYLDGPAFDAVEAFQRLCEEGAPHLADRLAELSRAGDQEWE